jgi:tetratricopeptide (TPR) repeat protein
MLDEELPQPEECGLVALPIPFPPMLEEALGYPGEERYVSFHEWRPDKLGFYIDDGQWNWQGSAPGWSLFLVHPAVTCICERARLDLHRSAPVIPRQEYLAMAKADKEQFWRQSRSLVLDRNCRRLYVTRRDNATFFVVASSIARTLDMHDEQDEEDADELHVLKPEDHELEPPEVDSQPPIPVARRTLKEMRFWLDHHDASLELNSFTRTPSGLERSGLLPVPLHVGDGIIEAAFEYRGNARYISLHWSPEHQKIFVCGGIGDTHYSTATEEWHQFLNHPLVIPRLRPFRLDRQNSMKIDFSARIGSLSDSPLFANAEEARKMEADVETNCLLLDRANDDLYVGPWSGAILFHCLTGTVVLEEDLAEKLPPESVPSLLSWLADQDNNVDRLLATAVAHSQSGEKRKALELLERCLELRAGSHGVWFNLMHAYAGMSNWPKAIEACEEAIKFHPTADWKYVNVEMLLKWRATFLLEAKRYADAIDAWKLLLEIDPYADRATIHSQIARCQTILGASDEVVLAREQVVKCRRESLQRGLSFRNPYMNFHSEEEETADEEDDEIEFIDELRQDVGNAWRDLGRAYAVAGRMNQSEWAYRQAIDASPASARARAELGVLLKSLGRESDAGNELAAALNEAREKAQGRGRYGPHTSISHSSTRPLETNLRPRNT